MSKFYKFALFFLLLNLNKTGYAQTCDSLKSTWVAYESMCMATGSLKITTTGGSGSYQYKVNGPVNTSFTSTDSITGLAAGVYTLVVNDIIFNCNDTIQNIIIGGTYRDPRFMLRKKDLRCESVNNGEIIADSLQYGRPPFSFTIIAPSPMGVGTSNATGYFTGLAAGAYSIQLRDSCGGVQTRTVNIAGYSWSLHAYPFSRIGCNQYTGQIEVRDILGRNSLVAPGLSGFTYGIIRSAGDTIQSASPNLTFTHLPNTSFQVFAKDSCGLMKRATVNIVITPSLSNTVNISNRACSTFTAAVQSVQNFTSPRFCLETTAGVNIACNNTGTFNNIPYGSYCIRAYDSCTNITITRCFTVNPQAASVAASVTLSNRQCTSFTATVSGQQNIFLPEYCLYNASNTLVSCNATGVFNNLAYGSYCIRIRDICKDTLITRCFTAVRPRPVITGVSTQNLTCSTMTVTATADTVSSGQFCLYNNLGVQIACNNSGVFNNVPAGDYCVTVYDACLDTTLTRCFTAQAPPVVSDLSLSIRNRACSTVSINASTSTAGAPFCLYDALGVLVSCNNTGVFDNVPYGYYCVTAKVNCPDTTFQTCINARKRIPSVNATVQITNKNCTGFSASITGQNNLLSPQYCLYNSANSLVSCNSTGSFNNLSFGSYCIQITSACYDTTITRCFTSTIDLLDIQGLPSRSCSLGLTDLALQVNSGYGPYNVVVLNPNQTTRFTGSFNTSTYNINGLPGLATGLKYTVIVADACNRGDTILVDAPSWSLTRTNSVQSRCPSAIWQTGSGSIFHSVTTNMSNPSVRIIKKNNIALSPIIAPSTTSGSSFSFQDLGPGVYILRTTETSCGNYYYDTLTVTLYEYPLLNNTRAYQCDASGFSIGTAVSKGVAPFTYEIIGSTPAAPSIVTAPQASPFFSINNGQMYSLIRLRVIDACGNASLGDASILPLTFMGIRTNNNCLQYPTTFNVDNIAGASYQWYRKSRMNSTDSTYLGNTSSYSVSQLLYADTGMYICYVSVHNGCVSRAFHYRVTGNCYVYLPLEWNDFSGKTEFGENYLNWSVKETRQVRYYVVERKTAGNDFVEISRLAAKNEGETIQQYSIPDFSPAEGVNFYRIRIVYSNDETGYSKIISLTNKGMAEFQVYPNPAKQLLNIQFKNAEKKNYILELINAEGQAVMQKNLVSLPGGSLFQLYRGSNIGAGMYAMKFTNIKTGQVQTVRVLLL